MLEDIHLDLDMTKAIVDAELSADFVCIMGMDARSPAVRYATQIAVRAGQHLASASGTGIMTSLGRTDCIPAISQLLAS